MLKEMLDKCSDCIFFDEGAEGRKHKSTPVHILSTYNMHGEYWGYEGKKINEVLHEGCDLGIHWHTIVLLPCDDNGTPICSNRSIINRYFAKSGRSRCNRCHRYIGTTLNGEYNACTCEDATRLLTSCIECSKISRSAHTLGCKDCGNSIAIRDIESPTHLKNTIEYQRYKLLYKSEPCIDKCKECARCFQDLADNQKGALYYRNFNDKYKLTMPSFEEYMQERGRKRRANHEYQSDNKKRHYTNNEGY